MNARITTSVLAAAIALWFVRAEAGGTSLPPLSISVQPAKTAAGQKPDRLLGDLIMNHLMKNKLPAWEFLAPGSVIDFDKLSEAVGKAGGDRDDAAQLAGSLAADVVIEYAGKALPAKDARVKISARDPHRGRQLFSLSASGKTAVNDLLPKVLAGLREHYFDLARNGTWYRVLLRKAPKGLAGRVEEQLKKRCHKTERPASGPGIEVQCKLASHKLAALVEKAIRARRPKARYEFVTKTSRLIEIRFF